MDSPNSVNSPRRTLSLSKQRGASVSSLDRDDKTGFGLSGEHGPKPSEVYGFVGSITIVVASGCFYYLAFDKYDLINFFMTLFEFLLMPRLSDNTLLLSIATK